MSRRIIFLPEADADLAMVRLWYSSGDGHAVQRFEEEVDRTIGYISQFPNGFPMGRLPFRFAPLAKFRYFVIYTIEDDAIVVYRIRHMHQRPMKRYFGGLG